MAAHISPRKSFVSRNFFKFNLSTQKNTALKCSGQIDWVARSNIEYATYLEMLHKFGNACIRLSLLFVCELVQWCHVNRHITCRE